MQGLDIPPPPSSPGNPKKPIGSGGASEEPLHLPIFYLPTMGTLTMGGWRYGNPIIYHMQDPWQIVHENRKGIKRGASKASVTGSPGQSPS